MIQYAHMEKTKGRLRRKILIGMAVTALIVLALVPVVVPTVVEYLLAKRIAAYGLFPDVRMSLGYCWRNGPGLEGDIEVSVVDSPWRISAEFGASCCEWSAAVHMPETSFSERDSTLRTLLARRPTMAVSNLVYSGKVSLEAKAERTFGLPVPVWSVRMPVRDLSAGCMANDTPYAVEGLRLTLQASGIADRLEIRPVFPRAQTIVAGDFALTNFNAAVHMTDRSFVVTEASAGIFDGSVHVYSLFLNRKSLSTGFTLFVDDIDTGPALAHIKGFRGSASGKLHGKTRLFLREGGKSLRLGDTFLYSTPGKTGKLKLDDATVVTDNLALAGLGEDTRDNVANALSDLDYSVLRFDLRRLSDQNAVLSVSLRGTARRGDMSAPVDLTLNFNGAIEQLLNTGLRYSALKKGKRQ